MTRRRLIISIGVLFAALAGLNALAGRMARTLPRLRFSQIEHCARVDYLVLGNSQIEAGFDQRSFQAALPPGARSGPVLNLGCGGTLPAETLQFYLAAQKKFPRLPCVIQGTMATQLTDPTDADWHDLAGNRALLYYSDFALGLSLYQPQGWRQNLQMHLTRHLPLVFERLNYWRHVELLRRSFGQWGLPPEKTNRFGRVSDFRNDPLQRENTGALAAACRQALQERRQLSRPVMATIHRARQSGSEIVFVQMPLPSAGRGQDSPDGAWARYRRYLRTLLEAEGAVYIDALAWFSNDEGDFMDDLHLSPAGAEAFSRRLAPLVGARVPVPHHFEKTAKE